MSAPAPLAADLHATEADQMLISMRTNCPPFVITAQFTDCHAAAARAKRHVDTDAIARAIKETLRTPEMFGPRSPEQCRTLVADRCAAQLRTP